MKETFECTVPHFREHTLQEGPRHFVLESRCGRYRACLPNAHRLVYESFRNGKTVREVAFSVRTQDGHSLGFRSIFRVLDSLCLTKLLSNWESFEPYLDQMRSSYHWQEPLIKQDLFSWDIPFREAIFFSSQGLSLVLSCLLLGSSLYLFSRTSFEIALDSSAISGARSVFLFLFLSSLMLSVKTLFSAFLTNLTTGQYCKFKLRINFLGIYLDGSYGSGLDRSKQKMAPRWIHLFSLVSSSSLILTLPFWAMKVSPDLNVYGVLLHLLPVIAMIEWSPFSKSSLTDALAFVYNEWGHEVQTGAQSGRSSWNDRRDQIIWRVHQGFVALWVVALLGYLVFVSPFFLRNALVLLRQPQFAQAVTTLLGLLAVFAGVLFVLSEFANGFGYTGPSRSFRRFWLVWDQRKRLTGLAHAMSSLDILREFPLFAGIRSDVQAKIAEHSTLVTLHRGTYICLKGEKRRDLFLVLSGSVGVYLPVHLGITKRLLELKSGSIVGEIGFLAGQRRTADVITLEETTLLRIGYNQETENLMISQDRLSYLRDRIWLLQSLVSTELFQKIPLEALQLILQLGKIVDHGPGTVVTRQGEAGGSFFVVIQGELRVTIDGGERPNLSRGDVFGEIALLFGTARTATVVTLDATKLLEISDQEFWYLLSSHFALGLHLERTALRRLHRDHRLSEDAISVKNAG